MAKDRVEVDVITNTRGATRSIGKYVIGIGAAVLALKALVRIGKDLVDAYAVQEKAETKLRTALRITGAETRTAMNSLKDYASSLQRVTLFGDEATLSAMAMIQQLGNLSENELKQATKATLDFATAFDLDLSTAASLVGKTLGSTTNALTRYGIEVDMSLGKSDKFASVVDGLTEKFEGMAEAAGENATAALQQYGMAMGDLKEDGGELIIRVFGPLVKASAAFLANLSEIKAVRDALAGKSGEGALLQALSDDAFQAYSRAFAEQEKLRAKLEDRGVIAGDWVGEGMRLRLAGMKEDTETLVEAWYAAADAVTAFNREGEDTPNVFTGVTDVDKVTAWKGALINAFADIDKAGAKWGDNIDIVAEKNKVFGDILSEMAGDDFRTYGDGILSLKEFFADELSPAIEKATEDLSTFGLMLGGGLNLPSAMPSAAPQPGTTMPAMMDLNLPTATMDEIIGFPTTLSDTFANAMAMAPLWFDPLELALLNIKEEEDLVAQGALDMADTFAEALQDILPVTTLIAGSFSTMFKGMGESAIKGGDAMKDAMKNAFASILGGLAALVWGQAAVALGAVLLGDMTKLPALAQTAVAGGILSTAQGFVTAMRDGGTVTRPTLAMIGEAGPETVTRADRGGRGGNVTIHVHGTIMKERELARTIGKLLYQDARGH